MNEKEARAWLNGERSMTNSIQQDPSETWVARIAVADAHMAMQAYWTLRAHSEGLLSATEGVCN